MFGSIGKTISKAVKAARKAASDAKKAAQKQVDDAKKVAVQGATSATKATIAAGKGDFKNAAKEGLKTVDIAKDFAKSTAATQATIGAGGLKAIGGLTGVKPASELGSNFERESKKGINQYGDVAMDVAANSATGGTYGAAKQMAQALAEGGIGGLAKAATSPEQLKQMALSRAGSYAGFDPSLVSSAKDLAQGKGLEQAALQASGVNPQDIETAKLLAQGKGLDKAALGAADVPDDIKSNLANVKKLSKGGFHDLKNKALEQAQAQSGINKNDIDRARQMKQLAETGGRGFQSAAMEASGVNPAISGFRSKMQQFSNINPQQQLQAGINSQMNDLQSGVSGQVQNLTEEQLRKLKFGV